MFLTHTKYIVELGYIIASLWFLGKHKSNI